MTLPDLERLPPLKTEITSLLRLNQQWGRSGVESHSRIRNGGGGAGNGAGWVWQYTGGGGYDVGLVSSCAMRARCSWRSRQRGAQELCCGWRAPEGAFYHSFGSCVIISLVLSGWQADVVAQCHHFLVCRVQSDPQS